jgi:hypothetical protein
MGSSRPPPPRRPAFVAFGSPDHCGSHRRQPSSAWPKWRRSGAGHRPLHHDGQRCAVHGRLVLGLPLGLGDRQSGPREPTANSMAARVGRTHPAIDVPEEIRATARRCRPTRGHPGRGVGQAAGGVPPSMEHVALEKSAPGPSGVTPEWDPAQAAQASTPAGRPPPSHGRCRSRARQAATRPGSAGSGPAPCGPPWWPGPAAAALG